MSGSIIEDISRVTGVDRSIVGQVVDQLAVQLHRRLVEYRGMNGDYIGEALLHEIGPRAFYHLLGFLDTFADKYNWGAGDAEEYLIRLGSSSDWVQYRSDGEP